MKAYRLLFVSALTIALWGLSACSTEIIVNEEPMMPSVTNPSGDGKSESDESRFTASSTVADVIGDPAFGDFGRLLFPVDRNVSPSMTLAQVSTSNVYMWYPYIRVEKTVEILNFLHAQAENGNTIFYSIYSPERSQPIPRKKTPESSFSEEDPANLSL